MRQLFNLLRIVGFRQLLKINKIHTAMLTYARRYMTMHCILVLSNLGFFGLLKTKSKIELVEYAKENNLDIKLLVAVCDYLFSLRILNRYNGSYSLTLEGKHLIEETEGIFNFLYAYAPLFENIDALVKKEKVYNKDLFRREEFVAKASAQIGQLLPIPVIKDVIRKYGFKKIIDLGCGSGEFLIEICKDTDLFCFGVDISEPAISYAKKLINKNSLGERIKLKVGDIFKIDQIQDIVDQADAAISMFVLHEFLSEDKIRIIHFLEESKKHFNNKYLIICELCRQSPESLREKPSAIIEHHLFHALSNQYIITSDEWRELFKKTGWKLIEERRFGFAAQNYFILR